MLTSGILKCVADGSPRQLSDDHQRARQTICQEHLDRHGRDGDAFVHRIVTGDVSWVYHYEPESKRQPMQWKHPSSPASKKFKTGIRWESHADHLLGCQWPYIVQFRKRVQL
jgi:hypothetical protein